MLFENTSKDALERLGKRVVSCRRCPRLIEHISKVARVKTRRYSDWSYWGQPLLGFGDPHARLLVIGLAPAAHGGNRTGRMFTGDSAWDWLIKALHETGFTNQPQSVSRDDGLRLRSAYITAVVRCAPPANRPTAEEIGNCSEYLKEEIRLLEGVDVVLTLGRIAFNAYLRHVCQRKLGLGLHFRHGKVYGMRDSPTLVASYHPSRQNTQTGRLTWEMWIDTFRKVREVLGMSEI